MPSLSDGNHSPPLWHGLAAGGCAALVSRVFTCTWEWPVSQRARRFVADNCLIHFQLADPPDTVKARLQIQEGGPNRLHYKGTFDAFVKVCA